MFKKNGFFSLLWINFFCFVLSLPLYANEIKILKVAPYQINKMAIQPTCLISNISLTNPSNWYAAATLTITNNCSSPQTLNNAVVSFQSNSNNISAMWGGVNSSAAFTYKGNIASTVLNIQSDPLLIGKSLILHFGINLSGTPFDLTTANNSLSVIPATSTPANGEIDVTVDPEGMIGTTDAAEIDITGPGLSKPYVIIHSNWSSPTTYKVMGLSYGTYQISALPVGTNYTGTASPSSVTLNSPQAALVTVTYKLAQSTGALQINLSQAPMQGLAETIDATVSDNTTNQSQVVNVAWGSYKLIPNLPVGHHYTVTFPQVSNGLFYSDPFPIENPMILQNRTTPLNVSYQNPQPVASQSVAFSVSGLTTDVLGTLTIVDGFGNKFTKSGFGNGQISQALPINNAYSVTASAPNMFATVTPSSFTLKNGSPSPLVTVQFTANPPLQGGAHFLAYADSGMQTNQNGLVPPKGGNMVEAFILYNPWKQKSVLWAIEEGDAISEIIKNTPNTMASVGGANGPFPWDYETLEKGVAEIESLIDYYHFIGIDFDVEGAALETPTVQEWVAKAAVQLRKDRPGLILIFTVPDPVIGFTTGTIAILNKTLSMNNNKMVFNWVNKMDFNQNGLGDGCSQTDSNMNNNCLVRSAVTGAQHLATMLGITEAQAYQYLGETFMIPADDQGHPLSLSLAEQVATTLKNKGLMHMGYWRIQNDDKNLSYGNMFTRVLGLS